MRLVLDGRQRLTALAIVFGGLHTPDDRYSYSGQYFLDLDADFESDKFIKYKKQREISKEQLDSQPNCVAKALIPLADYKNLNLYNQNIHNEDFYPFGKFPNKDIRAKRSHLLGYLYQAFQNCQIPIAELPETITLAEVCEIFDVLNTTGTKVSTFDLIHNSLYADTSGDFNLRNHFNKYQDETGSLRFLCDPDRNDYLCQIVTGCYLSEPEPIKKIHFKNKQTIKGNTSAKEREELHIKSIKGGDLIETPTSFYQFFNENIGKIDSYCFTLFGEVLGGEFRLKQVPYPVSLILYVSLRWRTELHPKQDDFTTEELNRLFRAFFWRNSLSGRYDQGFLTLFASDVKHLEEILTSNVAYRGSAEWCSKCDNKLDILFEENKLLSQEDLEEKMVLSEIHGALKQTVDLFLYSRIRKDIVSGTSLDRFTEDKNLKVQLHHIYPQKWCADNKGSHPILQEDDKIINCAANLVPLTMGSNNQWKTKAPNTAIIDFNLANPEAKRRFKDAYIDERSYSILASQSTDPKAFWEHRSQAIASELYKLQLVR